MTAAGIAQAVGVKFLDKNNKEIPMGGEGLLAIDNIDLSGLDKRIPQTKIIGMYDVNNPLAGEKGAAKVYGPQKGADPDMVELLDSGLNHFARKIKEFIGIDVLNMKGAGAAGGIAAGLAAFLGASIENGSDIVIKYTGFKEKIKNADLIITGEGKIDFQTQYGKTPMGVAKAAKAYNIPVIAICGVFKDDCDALYNYFDVILEINHNEQSLVEAYNNAFRNIQITSGNIARMIKIFK